jgi:hypothetical protein
VGECKVLGKGNEEETNDELNHTRSTGSRYLPDHFKSATHTRVARMENHNILPNIVGSWLPRRDGDEESKPYYYAAMLALLKPWRDLARLKMESEDWETVFNNFILNVASQRDKDVIAGCQYYYESKNPRGVIDENDEEEGDVDHTLRDDRGFDVEVDELDEIQDLVTNVSNEVSNGKEFGRLTSY